VLEFTLKLLRSLGNKQQQHRIKFIICLVLYILVGMSASALLLQGLPHQTEIKADVLDFNYRESPHITDLA
jgi:hypothetical protein